MNQPRDTHNAKMITFIFKIPLSQHNLSVNLSHKKNVFLDIEYSLRENQTYPTQRRKLSSKHLANDTPMNIKPLTTL